MSFSVPTSKSYTHLYTCILSLTALRPSEACRKLFCDTFSTFNMFLIRRSLKIIKKESSSEF